MSDELLRELIAGQKEQTELFRRYLWRLRFSLLGLLLLMTLTEVGLGIGVYLTRPQATTGIIPTTGITISSGTLQLNTTQPPTNLPSINLIPTQEIPEQK